MNKYFFAGIAVLVSLGLTGCSKEKNLYENNKEETEKKDFDRKMFEDTFVARFGTVASGHRWGFDHTKAGTRATITTDFSHYAMPSVVNAVEGNEIRTVFASATTQKLTQKEFTDVLKVDNVNLDTYFLQHVANSFNNSTTQTFGQLQVSSDGINWMDVAYFKEGKNSHKVFDESINQVTKGCTLLEGMGDFENQKFRCPASDKAGKELANTSNYRFAKINGEYFIGFANTDDSKDYSAWIMKLIPAQPRNIDYVEAGRVFCVETAVFRSYEYNCVVFDAYIRKNGNIDIEVLANGTYTPIKICGKTVSLTAMANTGNSQEITEKQTFTIAAENGKPKYATIYDIPVVVASKEINEYELKAEPGKVPSKICVPIGTNWAERNASIASAYPMFKQWVTTQSPRFWTEEENETYTDLDLSTK